MKFTPSFLKTAKWMVIIISAYTFIGFLILPPVLKLVLEHKLSEQLNREVKIRQINLNPYALSVRVEDFVIKGRDSEKPFISFKEFYANLQAASVIKQGLILREVSLVEPYANISRIDDTTYNFSDLMTGDKEEPSSDDEPYRFSVNNIQILNGNINFWDGPKNTQHKVQGITIKIPMVSNFSYFVDSFVQPFFQATANNTPILIEGNTKPFHDSLETVVDLDIKEIDIPHYIEYIPFQLKFKILSGMVSGNSRISFTQYKNKPSTMIYSGDTYIHGLNVVDLDDKPIIDIPVFEVKKAELDLSGQELTVGEVYSKSGAITLKRSKDGTLNLQRPLPKLAEELEEAAEKKEERPWIVLIKNMAFDDYIIKFEDQVPGDPVHLIAEDIKLKAENISTEKNKRWALSYAFKLNKTGTISGESSIGINPVSADVKLGLKNINIVPLQPYIADNINLLIRDGIFSTEGDLSYESTEKDELRLTYKGKASLSKFSAVDRKNKNDFLKWKSLYLSGLNFDLEPLSVNINGIAITDFYSLLIVNPDGTLNVQGIVKEEPESTEGTPPEEIGEEVVQPDQASTPQIKINEVTLQGGNINFTDRHIKPGYSANMLEIGGRISGLSSEEGSRAEVDLRGKLENHAPLEIKGKMNPLGEDLFVDLGVSFKDMDLSPLTPYAGRYVGYTIRKGKLSLDLNYLIENNKLESTNSIFLDQFTFGNEVESPDATSLPVRLGIALLKNSKGEIKLDLPVSGNLDDPQFSIGSIVFKMIVNIFVKAATSPFALLGALVGGGEELSYVEFDYGSFKMSEGETGKLDKLIEALGDRPNLNIDIEAYVDTEADREGLRQYTFKNKLRAQKLEELIKDGQTGVSVDEIDLSPEEHEEYLWKAYKKEEFPKPRNIIGMVKKLSPEEMEKLMLTHIKIGDDDLKQLAAKRALSVKDYLLKTGMVESERVFLAETGVLEPEKQEKLKSSRVDFKLK